MIKQKRKQARIRSKLTGHAIDAMSPVERQRLVDKLESETPRQCAARCKPLTPRDEARMDRVVKAIDAARKMEAGKMGRPKLGKGTRVVSVTVEIDLLERADAYARKAGMKRAELFTKRLKLVVPPTLEGSV